MAVQLSLKAVLPLARRITIVIWCYHKTFSQWEHSFHWKLCCHWLKGLLMWYEVDSKTFSHWERSFHWKLRCQWLKGLWQHQITVVIQWPTSHLFKDDIHCTQSNVKPCERRGLNKLILWVIMDWYITIQVYDLRWNTIRHEMIWYD